MDSIRGLVVSPPIQVHGNSILIKSSSLDSQELRANLLFWDKLDFPTQNALHIDLDADAEFLKSAGVLQRTTVRAQNGQMSGILRAAHIDAFRVLDEKEPGQWSVATGEKSISFTDSDLEDGRGVLVKLYNAIPVPNEDVALADILEFRTKRRSELLSLRHHLEDVYQRVIGSGDGPLALNTEIEKLQLSIADHIKASREAPFKFRMSDISASLNLIPVGIAAIAAFSAGLPIISSVLPGAAAEIKLNAGAALKKHSAVPTPFKYVSSYHNEFL